MLRVVREEAADCIVVGLPISLDGTLHGQAQRTQAFCEALRKSSPIPVENCDERFSTAEAEYALRDVGIQPSRQKWKVDAIAAAVILQRWLDRENSNA